MKNTNIQKINKMGKVVKILTKILMVFAIIGTVFCIIGSISIEFIDTSKIRIEGDINAKLYISDTDYASNPVITGDGSLSLNDEVTISKEDIKIEDYLTLYLSAVETKDDQSCYSISSNLADDFNIDAVKKNFTISTIQFALMNLAIAIGMGFASSLAKALENCETPFSEEIVKRMKAFAYSMIPYAVLGGIDGTIELAICVIAIIIMIFIFSYGCSIQNENDDTI